MSSADQRPAGSPGLLQGKVALITGASRGIGAAAARAFAEAGARVVLSGRDEEALDGVAAGIRAAGQEALVVRADVTQPEQVSLLVQRAVETYGRLDAAFNNAGAGRTPTPLADIPIEDFEAILRVDLLSVFLSMKFEIPALLAGGGGVIVNMSSTAGLAGAKGIAPYAAAKHGVVGLTRVAALDYADQGLRVVAVAPGPTANDRVRVLPPEVREQIARAVPMHRIGKPEEIAALVVWLCSDQASFVTGATFSIDGGRLAGSM